MGLGDSSNWRRVSAHEDERVYVCPSGETVLPGTLVETWLSDVGSRKASYVARVGAGKLGLTEMAKRTGIPAEAIKGFITGRGHLDAKEFSRVIDYVNTLQEPEPYSVTLYDILERSTGAQCGLTLRPSRVGGDSTMVR